MHGLGADMDVDRVWAAFGGVDRLVWVLVLALAGDVVQCAGLSHASKALGGDMCSWHATPCGCRSSQRCMHSLQRSQHHSYLGCWLLRW